MENSNSKKLQRRECWLVNFEAVGSKEKDSHVSEFFCRYKKIL
jgi:hypothetical protein